VVVEEMEAMDLPSRASLRLSRDRFSKSEWEAKETVLALGSMVEELVEERTTMRMPAAAVVEHRTSESLHTDWQTEWLLLPEGEALEVEIPMRKQALRGATMAMMEIVLLGKVAVVPQQTMEALAALLGSIQETMVMPEHWELEAMELRTPVTMLDQVVEAVAANTAAAVAEAIALPQAPSAVAAVAADPA